ncbi:MAG: DegT/DnrJ/EryC1/StrS family aminotransferase [Smithella sp.]|jgi:dTDP-4-amino-4,6-dideoxygalactose transaminase|nr:DegT/DnrJ/EryC1/StrS family aminotransferase [Smithella sp.]
MIPMVDLKRQYHNLKKEIDVAISDVLEETRFILGPHVSALEEEIAAYVDICPDTYNLDCNQIADKITSKTKAIIPVHLFGHPADMQPIMEIARKHQQEVFLKSGNIPVPLPQSERCAQEVLSLPMFPELNREEIRLIADVINHVS